MKKIIAIVCILLFSATAVLADDVEDNLAGLANEQVMVSTRLMIQNGIESEDAIRLTRLMLQNQFSNQQTLKAQEMLMQALQSGIPAEPVMNKAYEGIAKKVQSRFVLQAMERVQSRYAFAYSKAGQLTEDPEAQRSLGTMMAHALAAGFEREDMDPIMDRLQERTQTMERKGEDNLAVQTCMMLRDMARLGVSSDVITDVVSQALNQEYTAQEMEALRESFMYAARTGSPEDKAKAYATQMRQEGSSSEPGSSDTGGSGASGETGGPGSGGEESGGNESGNGGDHGSGPGGPGGGHN